MKWRRDGTEAVPYNTNRGANGLLPNGNISSLANPSALRATVSLRLGHGAALTCPRHVIHYRAAASLPKRGAKSMRRSQCSSPAPIFPCVNSFLSLCSKIFALLFITSTQMHCILYPQAKNKTNQASSNSKRGLFNVPARR